MKRITISESCNQCGICALKCPAIFIESDNGDIITASDNVPESNELSDAVNSCPLKAISISEGESKKDTIIKYLNELESLKKGITVTTKDIEFGERYYNQYFGCSIRGENHFEYKSSRAAEKAGQEAFYSQIYSNLDKYILERITRYRVEKIRPYYSKDENSVYTIYNKKIEKVLYAISTIIGKEKFDLNFCTVDCFPVDDTWKWLEKGERIGANFIRIVKDEFDYKASDYYYHIDTLSMPQYRGRDKHCYINVYDAAKEFGKDLNKAFQWAKSDLEECSLNIIITLVSEYNKSICEIIDDKIKIINKVKN